MKVEFYNEIAKASQVWTKPSPVLFVTKISEGFPCCDQIMIMFHFRLQINQYADFCSYLDKEDEKT